MIDPIKKRIDQTLIRFMETVKKEYKLDLISPALYASIKEYCLRPGKRIRPVLLLLSYLGYSKKKNISASAYRASICVELLHNFMLIHDDIIDKSDLRRGKPTLHKILGKMFKSDDQEKLGYDLAIIAGDIVYSFAIDAFLSIDENLKRKEQALKYFIQTAGFTAMGEFIDTAYGFQKLKDVKEEDVFLNYTLKTARYTFVCPLTIGAILGGASSKELELLFKLGIHIGQAFQIQDDIIGIFGTEKSIGKSILSDLQESKKTLLVSHAFEHLSAKKRKTFTAIFNKPKKTLRDLKAVQKLFIESGSLSYCLEQIKTRTDAASVIFKELHMKKAQSATIQKAVFQFFKQSEQIVQKYNLK